MYEVNLKKNTWTPLPTDQFRHSTDGSLADQRTKVHLKQSLEYLHAKFQCFNNPFTAQNSMTEHNDNLFNQEVFELFIAPAETDPFNYLEFEINPNNAIWVGHVFNPTYGEEGNTKVTIVPYNESKITHSASKTEGSWSGEFAIPWSLIGDKREHYRINFYRIVSKVSQKEPNWLCSPENCDFTCWSPTISGENPAFHKPKKFGIMRLNQ